MSVTKVPIIIDIVSDTVCPWCYVGKKYLEKAMASVGDKYDFKVVWHPYMLDPSAPVEGADKREYYEKKFTRARVEPMIERMTMIFAELGLQYSLGGLTGNTLDSHRLINLAGQQSSDKQNKVVEALMRSYFTEEKFINSPAVLLSAARDAGVEGAEEYLSDRNAGRAEVLDEISKVTGRISGVPHFTINGIKLSGAQPPEAFLEAFEQSAKQQ